MAKHQKLGLNTATNVVKLVSELSEKVALPAGVILRDADEVVEQQRRDQNLSRSELRDQKEEETTPAPGPGSPCPSNGMIQARAGPTG